MGVLNRDAGVVRAKIVYFGPTGAGASANLQLVQKKLKREHRGELTIKTSPGSTRVPYELLPVQLGSVRGLQTSIHICTVPSGEDNRALRREILNDVDGVVFVADTRPERHDASVAALEELREHLTHFGRTFDEVVLTLAMNRVDQSGPEDREALERRLGLKPNARIETVAHEGTGVLECLTLTSRSILDGLAEEEEAEGPAPAREVLNEGSDGAPADRIELVLPDPNVPQEMPDPIGDGTSVATADVASAYATDEAPDKGFSVESAGPVEAVGNELRIPIRLVSPAGEPVSLTLQLSID